MLGHRFCEQETLQQVGPVRAKERLLRGVLDALGDHLKI